MDDIELVIKIPKDYYEILRKNDIIINGLRSGKTFTYVICNAVANGTPLTKGHEELKKEPKEITFDDVQRYCKSRCLTIITNELLYQFIQDTANMDRQNAICKSHRIVGDKYECCFAEKGQPVVHCGGDKNKCEILDEEED